MTCYYSNEERKNCDGLSICSKCDHHCGCVCNDFRQTVPYKMGSKYPRAFRCCFCHLIPKTEERKLDEELKLKMDDEGGSYAV